MEKPACVSDDCLPFLENISDMLGAPYFVENGMEAVRISKDCVEVRKTVLPKDRNSNGFWHGGAIYGVMDHTFAILSNIEGHAVGQNSNLNYYRPGRGDVITAKAKFINVSRSLYHVYVEAFDGEKLVASGIFTSFRLQEIHD
ncbi:MAG: PaaI family thioesterase [Candidatus Methanomethylophilus sp.]|nr:PaaI family thioesterase [Methanomethylophilus sp.]